VDRVINSKVVDLLILYHFYKGCIVFFSIIFAQIGCQDAEFLGSSEQWQQTLTLNFHQFALQTSNATQHESCVPQQNTQLLYWENLKCLGEIWRTWQKFRLTLMGQQGVKGFWVGFWPRWAMVDQKVSLGIVGDVYEMMSQVDRRLTKVNTVDRIIRVN
jgi:hypothetical protein